MEIIMKETIQITVDTDYQQVYVRALGWTTGFSLYDDPEYLSESIASVIKKAIEDIKRRSS